MLGSASAKLLTPLLPSLGIRKATSIIYNGELHRGAFYERTVGNCTCRYVQHLVSSVRVDYPRIPFVTLIQRLCSRHFRLDGSMQSDRLRRREYRGDVCPGL